MSTSLLQLARLALVPYTKSPQRCLSSFALKGVHEPEYLDYLKPQIPYYNAINIQVILVDQVVIKMSSFN